MSKLDSNEIIQTTRKTTNRVRNYFARNILTNIKMFSLMLGAVLAGYTITDLPTELLDKLNQPQYMFFAFFLVSLGLYDFDLGNSFIFIILDSVIFTVIVIYGKRYIKKKYKKEKIENFEDEDKNEKKSELFY